jgi:penicillin-binding protein 2
MTLGQNTAGRDLKARLFYLGLILIGGLFVLAIKIYRLQITQGEEYAQKSVANFVKEIRVRADRGMIKDATGQILVDNRPSFDVFVTPAFCEKCLTDVLPRVGALLDWDAEDKAHAEEIVRQGKRRAPFRQVPVRIDLSRNELDRLSAHLIELPGVEVLPVAHRSYHEGPVLSHLLGYMNEITTDELERLNGKGSSYELGDYIGRRGIERAFEKELRGVDGLRKEVVNARGQPIAGLNRLLSGEESVAPRPGQNVILSIDMRLQQAAEKAFDDVHGLAGAVVAVDVNTGFIKALVSRPGYDPNLLTGRITSAQMARLSNDPLRPMIFRATQERYSPGSTFKPLVALAGLKAGMVTPNTIVNCPGGYRLGRRTWRCDVERGHGPLSLEGAISRSCDVYFYKLGDQLGIDRIADMARSLGLGTTTGFGVMPEVPGIIPDEAYYDKRVRGGYQKGFALNASIGQGDVNVTPLQMAMAYAALANGGTVYRPQIVQRLETPDGKVTQTFAPEIEQQAKLDPAQREAVVAGMKAVLEKRGGTAYGLAIPGVSVAGKTGTAQVAAIGKVRVREHNLSYWAKSHSWFDAFAPAEAPQIAVVTINEHGGYGASAAAPITMKVIQTYFELKAQDAKAEAARLAQTPSLSVGGKVVPASATLPAPGSPTQAPASDDTLARTAAEDR